MAPSVQSRAFSTSDPQTQIPSSSASNGYSYPRGTSRTESFANPTPMPNYPSSTLSDVRSPYSTDYTFQFSGSPQSSGTAAAMDAIADPNFYGQRNIPDITTGRMAQHRASFGSVGTQGNQQHSGSIAESDTWTPASPHGQVFSAPDQQVMEDGQHIAQNDSQGNNMKAQDTQNDFPPAWSELRTKAGKERKRLPLACIACRRKKIRCSGEKPACKHCLRSRIPCVYKVTTRKAAPRTDYMAMLDKRLKRMEERVIKIIPKEELPEIPASTRASVRPPVPGQTPKPAKVETNKKRSADQAFMLELDQWTRTAAQSNPADGTSRLKSQKDSENKLLTDGMEFLPPVHIQEHLAEVFFDCIYGQSYLLLHKPSFMRKLKAGTIPPVLALAVCAISARFSTHPEVGGEPAFLRGDSWATPARAIVEKRHYEPNITVLTVMLILGLHCYGTCEGGLSWSFSGQAMRMAYALQLHKELDHDPLGRRKDKASELSFTDREIRRRTMWACFLMDRFSASGTERPSFGNEDYLHIQLPIKEYHFQMEIPGPTENLTGEVPNPVTPGNGQISDAKENMGVAAYVIRAVVLWGRIVKYLNLGGKEKDPHPIWHPDSGFAELRRQLDEFRDSIPTFLIYNTENLQNQAAERVANQFLYLHIICQQNLLFLNRFAIPVSPGARPPKDMPNKFLSDAGREVVEAANQISTLIEHAAGHMLTVPFAGYCAYAASTVQVWGIFSKNPQLEASAKENLRHNYKYLNKMKKYWGMFHYLAESVKAIYRHFADAAIKGLTPADNSAAATPMFQYGDWFDKYPVGVSKSDWEDSERVIKEEPAADAVMSQQSDLQSVEEFFASLSPPSKSEQPRKIARRHGKTQSASDARKAAAMKDDINSPQHAQPQTTTPHLGSLPSNTEFTSNPNLVVEDDDDDNNNNIYSTFDPNVPFDFNTFYPTNPLPQLDRQMVFGAAYAGMHDASNNHDNNFGLVSNMWDGLDMNGFGGGNGYLGQSSTAWFMPFNLEPPTFGDVDNGLLMGDFRMGNSISAQGGGQEMELVMEGQETGEGNG